MSEIPLPGGPKPHELSKLKLDQLARLSRVCAWKLMAAQSLGGGRRAGISFGAEEEGTKGELS